MASASRHGVIQDISAEIIRRKDGSVALVLSGMPGFEPAEARLVPRPTGIIGLKTPAATFRIRRMNPVTVKRISDDGYAPIFELRNVSTFNRAITVMVQDARPSTP